MALLRASNVLDQVAAGEDERIGVNIIGKAVEEPMRWIATNAGHEGSIVVQRTRAMTGPEGFNAQTEQYEDLIAAGVDPTKVVRSALQNAASIASLLLTTEAVVSMIPESSQDGASAMNGMGGGGIY